MAKEFVQRQIPFQDQSKLSLTYKGKQLTQTFRPDFICYDQIIVELKAIQDVGDRQRAQVFNYLKASGLRLGLLVIFGH